MVQKGKGSGIVTLTKKEIKCGTVKRGQEFIDAEEVKSKRVKITKKKKI